MLAIIFVILNVGLLYLTLESVGTRIIKRLRKWMALKMTRNNFFSGTAIG